MVSVIADSHWLNARAQRWFVFSGVAAVPVMFLGLVLARVFPAHNATWTADRIVQIYAGNSDVIQLGCLLMMIAFAFWGWWQAVISVWVWRIESPRYPVLTFATLILAAINTMVVEIMSIMYAVAAFRAGRIDPEITLTLNDLAWFFYYYTWPPYVLWLIAIAVAILRDNRSTPYFPRWLAWFTLAQVVTILPNGLQTFSFGLVGPFAWDGFVTCVVVAGFHGVWTIVLAGYILKAISREEKGRGSVDQLRDFPTVV
ncbi:hypothetical protein MFORT_21960 [Mycolicibacterium fortuitum subsp. fortuitum DSM 46621 = ATCC 6841 = JCM 6387]|uniref:Uncharacterized protein n=1 Tax=Mycolicibacterium fortuitum subsp. fortuitum DSM 46621 = ATCC 6841 = JCM 6387 TaxID=1214102 RepID=K0UR98_MYCFO|nr:hypothetical protein MFORT_21960 [Mycolicibacterium fortuitum subsp. fortuitum DSM 46621 = ATCC 6841 = JCM 6387]BDE00613.1 hypothetical protein MFTT_47060 [Mycolicibacterium fortuitum subsp. fortuitum]CRL55463.1 hypothetical protein CPGR_02767 [Mycolicibacterium fortuitum subsp. fortuitum DSM 46621 = ATCC 6841 = JCM 6387]